MKDLRLEASGCVKEVSDNHSHGPSHADISVRLVNEKLKKEAYKTTKSSAEVLSSSIENLPLDVISYISMECL